MTAGLIGALLGLAVLAAWCGCQYRRIWWQDRIDRLPLGMSWLCWIGAAYLLVMAGWEAACG